MKSVVKKLLFAAILMSFASFLCADFWTITDWSYATSFDSIVNLNGTRQPGNLILDAPDIWNWEYMASLSGAQNVYDIDLTPDGAIYAATGDVNGDVFKSVNSGEIWDTTANIAQAKWIYDLLLTSDSLLYAANVKGNLSSYVAFSNNPDSEWNMGNALEHGGSYEKGVYCVVEAQNYLFCGAGFYLTTAANIYSSDKGTSNWTFKTGFTDNQILCMCAISPQTIVAGTGNSKGYVLRSYDGGENWSAVDSLNCAIEAIVGMSNGICFLGTSDGRVFASKDSGLVWTATSALTGANEISSLFIDDKGIVYAGANATGNQAKVYFSTNNGISWNVSGNFTGRSNILSQVGLKNGFLFVGTNVDASVYRAGYFVKGCLISKPFYTGTTNGSTKYGIIHWIEELTGKILNVRVRTSQDSLMSTAMPWSAGVPACTNGDSIVNSPAVNNGDPYIQYRVEFSTDDPGITLVLNELLIEYSIDTLGPKPVSAVAYDGTIQQNGIDADDYVIISFDEPTNAYHIPKDSIDYYLKLNQGSWGVVDTAYWSNVGNASDLTVELNATSTIPIGVRISPDTVIEDVWNNNAYSSVTLTGTFDDTIAPTIISACASDNIDSIQGIDGDDFVKLIFDQTTDTPLINSSNISNILRLSSGHTWAIIDSTEWAVSGKTLTVFLDTIGTPTIEVGDTISPDSSTIKDLSGNPCISPRVLVGTFGDYGPVIDSALAYEASPYIPGVDSGDYVYLYFNEKTNAPSINSGNINSILKLDNGHSWNIIIDGPPTGWNGAHTIFRVFFKDNTPTLSVGDTIYPDSITILDTLDQPCIHPIVLTGTFNPGIEETKTSYTLLPTRLNLSILPNPCANQFTISYAIPLRNSALEKSSVRLEMFDVSGRKLKTLINQTLLPGRYSLTWKSTDIKPGIYFIKITSLQNCITRKLILLR